MSVTQDSPGGPLFEDISKEDCRAMLACFHAEKRRFRPDELIYDFGSDKVGVIEEGEAVLVRIDEDGVSTILENLGPGGVFGKTLAFAMAGDDSLEVLCRKPCAVTFIDYEHILKRCRRACRHHSILVRNMLELMADKAQALSQRVDVLSRRSIREKLLCCFRQFSQQAGSETFTLPFSLSALADYIATDRSAMMRELKRLREEGAVRSEGRQFTLCRM